MKQFPKFNHASALTLALVASALTASAQEKAVYFPLQITDGLNADLICEQLASTSDYGTVTGAKNDSKGTYRVNKYSSFIDGDTSGGWHSFYTTSVLASGGITLTATEGLTGYYTLGGHSNTGIDYIIHNPSNTSNNALRINNASGGVNSGTLTLKTMDGSDLFVADTLYVVGTATEGGMSIKVTALDESGNELGSATEDFGDWASTNTTSKKLKIIDVGRIVVKGTNNAQFSTSSSNAINYIEYSASNSFCLQSVHVPTTTNSPVDKITVSNNETSTGTKVAGIYAVTARGSEVTEKDSETSLDYLVDETSTLSTKPNITEKRKYKVNLHRSGFRSDKWNPFIFNCKLTVAEVKEMLGDNIKLSVAADDSYKGNRLVFKLVPLTENTATAVEPGKYYLVYGVTTNTDGVYSVHNLSYTNPKNSKTTEGGKDTAPDTYTIKNEDQDEITFHGTYVAGTSIGVGSYALSNGTFYQYTDNPTIKGFRFWFTCKENEPNAAAPTSLALYVADETTGIERLEAIPVAGDSSNAVYSLDGRLVRTDGTTTGLQRGIYIVGGKKVAVK